MKVPYTFISPPQGRERGFTLVETMISTGISGFLFLSLAFLTFFAARNTAVVHTQITSQLSAASASERIATELRHAVAFERFSDDTLTSGMLKKVRYIIPDEGETYRIRALRFDAATSQVQIIDLDDSGAIIEPPRHAFRHIADLDINWESEFRLGIHLTYHYRGFALYLEGQGNPQFGNFVTDIIAKNHFMDQGVENYALSDDPTSGPASL